MKKKELDGFVEFVFTTRSSEEIMNKSLGNIIYNKRTETDYDEILIGTFAFYYLDYCPMAYELHSIFEAHSFELCGIAEDMVNENLSDFVNCFSFMDETHSLVLLDRIEIMEEYRGYGIARDLIGFFKHYFGSATILLKAFPLQYEGLKKCNTKEFKEAEKKVIKAYKDCGMKQVKRNSPYLYSLGGTLQF